MLQVMLPRTQRMLQAFKVTRSTRKEAHHNKSKKKTKRKAAKRKLLVEGEEGTQQLDILHSLGITGAEEWTPESGDSKKKTRRKKPNR